VTVFIDTAAPSQLDVSLSPTGNVDPGTIVTVKLNSSDALSAARFEVAGNFYDMTRVADGSFTGSFASPIEFGTYPLNFTVTDELGNESDFSSASELQVGRLSQPPSAVLVADVSNLNARAADRRVTLNWDPVTESTNGVEYYRVYYGLSANSLVEVVDTFSSSTTWYVPDLKNGVRYYFAVVAVDSRGNTSERFSNIVSSTPGTGVGYVVDPAIENGTAGGDALEDMESEVSETGPEILWLVLLSMVAGWFYNRTRGSVRVE